MFNPNTAQNRRPMGGAGDRLKSLRKKLDSPIMSQQAPVQAPQQMAAQAPMGRDQAIAQAKAKSKNMLQTQGRMPGAYDDKKDGNLDRLRDDWIRGIMTNETDTSEQEALARELGIDAQQQKLVGSRARMGRSGMGESGASVAMEGDIMRQAGQATSGQIIDIQNDARQQDLDNQFRAADLNRQLDQDASDQALQDALIKLFGTDVDPVEPGSANVPRTSTVEGLDGKDIEVTEGQGENLATSVRDAKYGEDMGTAVEPPEGSTKVDEDQYGTEYWEDSNGKIWRVLRNGLDNGGS